jgi:hypothetical protein
MLQGKALLPALSSSGGSAPARVIGTGPPGAHLGGPPTGDHMHCFEDDAGKNYDETRINQRPLPGKIPDAKEENTRKNDERREDGR